MRRLVVATLERDLSTHLTLKVHNVIDNYIQDGAHVMSIVNTSVGCHVDEIGINVSAAPARPF